MFKEIKNNVYNALFVVADEDGRRYAAFENDWNGEYYEATACTESGELVAGESVKLYQLWFTTPKATNTKLLVTAMGQPIFNREGFA